MFNGYIKALLRELHTEVGQEIIQERLRDIKTVVVPDVICQACILFVLIVIRDPQLRRPVVIRQIERLIPNISSCKKG